MPFPGTPGTLKCPHKWFKRLALAIDQILIELVRSVSAAKGAIVIASDGEAIAWCAMNDEVLRLRGAYLSLAIKSLTESRAIENLGKIEMTIFEYQGASFLVQRLDADACLAV